MAKGKRNNKRGRGGNGHNTTNDSDANLSNIAHDGNGDHKGFSTGAFGTSDIDGSGLQSDVTTERSELNRHEENTAAFRPEVHIPSRSRTSSFGADANDGFLNPNDYAIGGLGQSLGQTSSVMSRTSINTFEKAHRMSQLSIQTNQDEFVLVPGSGGHDGHASVRSMRSQVSRQSANVAMSSRDDILTEGDETGGDELREEGTRDRLGSRASQLSRGSRGSTFGAAVDVPAMDEPSAGFRSRRQSESANEWEKAQTAQDKRSHTSLYSHKSNGWSEREAQSGYVPVPSHHASRTSVHSRGEDGWEGQAAIEVPVQLSRHPSRASLVSHRSNVAEDAGFGENRGHSSRAPSHHASRMSVMSHRSKVAEDAGFGENRGHSSRAPSHHASKVSIHSQAGGDAGITPFTASRPQSVHASAASLHSHAAGEAVFGDRAPSHHASRASIHAHACGGEGAMNGISEDGVRSRGSGTSTRSQLSCIACGDDNTEEGMTEDDKFGLPQSGDEIEVPPEAMEEWRERVEVREEAERMMDNREYREIANEWGDAPAAVGDFVPQMEGGGRGLSRSAFGSRTSMASHAVAAPSNGGRSHHASRMSMRSNVGGMEENDDGGHGMQAAFGGSAAPIPAVRLSRVSLNQPNMDWNHNSMGSLNGGEEFTDQNRLQIPSHHASKMSLLSARSEMAQDPTMQPAFSKASLHSHQSAPRERRFSSRSTQDVAEWGETVNDDDEEEVFEHHGGYAEYDGGMSRGISHRSIYSTRSSKAGEQTEENLLQARLNRSREPSLASLADRPYIPPKDGWKSSAFSVNSTNEEERKARPRRHSHRASIHLVGTGMDLMDEVIIPLSEPLSKPRSRSASVVSRRSFEGVNFAEQPELFSHPDDRFGGDKSIEGIPFRRTNEHEKTPQPSSKRSSKVFKHNESEEELRALVTTSSGTSVVENTPPPSAGFQTPKSRNSRESYVGTGENSMPSPSPFNQTQFQRDEYEAHKERVARASTELLPFSPSSPSSGDRSEIATQTGETIARAAGQRFALHYGATLSAMPRRGQPGLLPPSARSSTYSMAPAPPSCSPPHDEEAAAILQHHQPMGEEERRRHMAALYDHGDGGDINGGNGARKSSSNSSSRFAPLPTYDMSYVEQYEARSQASASKTTTTSSASSSTLKSQQYMSTAASAASSYVDHLRPVQPSPGLTNVAVNAARSAHSMEMTTHTASYSGGYNRQEREELLFSPSKGSVAQKTAAFRQKEEAERGTAASGGQEYSPVYKNYVQQQLARPPVTRQVPIELVRGQQIVVPPQREREQPKVVNVEIKRAASSVAPRPMQSGGYVHIERPKMNNSFERNNHPAAAALNSLLSARASGSPNSTRSEENPVGLSRQASVGGTSGGYLPQYPMSYVPPAPPLPSGGQQSMGMPKGVTTSPNIPGYQRSIRPLASEDATFHYEMKHDLTAQQRFEKRMSEEISKDEASVLDRVGAIRADLSPKGEAQMRQPLRSREAEKAYNNYHDNKSLTTPSSVPITSAPKPFTPASPYRSVALGQQQQVYGAFRVQPVPQTAPMKKTLQPQQQRGGVASGEKKGAETAEGPIDHSKYTGSTIRRAIPQRGHIRNLAAAFDQADREVTIIEPHNTSVLQRQTSSGAPPSSGRGVGGSTSSATSSARGFAPRSQGMHQNGGGREPETVYRVPVHLQHTGTTTTSGSTRVEEEREMREEYERMRSSGYDERSIHEWQSANEQMRQVQHLQQREEQVWSGREHEEEEELILDSESDRPASIHSGGRRGTIPAHVLRTSTPLAGVKHDPSRLARQLEKIPSIRGDDTLGRGRATLRGVRSGGVLALASRFEKAAEEEKEKARSTSMTPRMRRRQESRRVDGDGEEDRREAAARRLSRGMGGVERLEREKEKRRSQSANVAMRKRRTSSTSDSGEESVMREMEAVERMAREEILLKEREEMRERKAMKSQVKKEERRPSEEERKIDEMFHGLESQESAGERGTMASSRGTISGTESLRTDKQELQRMQHPIHDQQHQHYQYQQKYREHNQHQHHHYQSHLQSVTQQGDATHLHSIPSQQAAAAPHNLPAYLHPIGANGGLEHGVVSRRESSRTMTTTNTQSSTATGLVYSPSVYRETGRALRGDVTAPLNGSTMMQLPVESGRASAMGGMEMNTTASSPHFSPVNVRGTETAGQRMATYESRDGKNPVRVPSRQVRPYALATSTPMGTVQSAGRGTSFRGVEGVVIPPDAVEDDSFLSTISGDSRGSAVGRSQSNQAEYKKQMARMQTIQSMEEEKISITSKALAHARKKQNPNNELAAQRTILLARLRVAALKRELQRLSALAIVRNPPPPVNKSVLGAMDISDITLHLNRNLCARPTDGGSCSFGFIVVLKCGVEVEATAPVCLLVPQRPAGVKVVHFPEHLRFSNLPVDFAIRLEVYVMKLREQKEESCTALLATKARNLLGPSSRRAAITAGPGGSTGSGGSPSAINGELPVGELVRCGHTALDRDSVGSIRLYLDAPEYPLEGTIELTSRCSRLPSSVDLDLRGFLTMYKVVGGYGSWVRYWAVLRRGIINFWKYPDDEQLDRGGPVASADLSKCTDSEIVPASREICTRQFAFSIDMLVATTPSIVEKKRVLLAADARDQLKAWLSALNETLAAIRA